MSTLKGTTMHPRCRHIGACWDLLEWFQLFNTSQNTSRIQFLTFLKIKIKFLGFHGVVLMKTFPLMYQLLLDVDPRRDDDASPMSTYRCMLRPTWMISSLWHKSKFNFEFKKEEVKIQFRIFLNQIIMFPCSSTLEDLSIDVSDTNVGLILTKLRRFQLFVKIRISNFFEKKTYFGFPWCSTREDLSIDVSITNVGLILTKLRWFQLFVKSQNSNFELFWKNSNFWVSML